MRIIDGLKSQRTVLKPEFTVLVTSIKKTLFLLCCAMLASISVTNTYAEPGPNLDSLTKLTIELRRELLEIEDKLSNLSKNNLSIYLNIDNLPQKSLQDIVIKLDEQVISALQFDETEYQTLANGAMKKIFSATVPPGKHTITTAINNAADADHHSSQSMILHKGKGKDVLKITISSLLRDPKPGIFFDHEQGPSK